MIWGRSSAFWLSGDILLLLPWIFRRGTIRRYRTIYYLSSSYLCVVFLSSRYLTCAAFPLVLWRSHDRLLLVSFSLLCVMALRAWYAHLCSFPWGDNSILYADGRRHFCFLATYYWYSLGLFGEAPAGDIRFDTYMCGRSSRNILRSYSSIDLRISHSSSQFSSGTGFRKLYYT